MRRLPRAQRERQLLDAARAQFAARGYARVTMDEVAAAVGVTKPLLYTYFGNKEQLYLACMEPAAEALTAAVLAAVERAGTPAEALHGGVHAFFAFVDQERGAWRILFDETLPAGGEVARRVAAHRERLTALIAGTQRARLPGTPPERVDALAVALLGAAEALARWWLRTEAMSAGEAAELLVRTLAPGLRVDVEPAGRSRMARRQSIT